MITKNKRYLFILLCIAFLLLIPLIAMQFTNEVNWTTVDFIIAGVLLLGTGIIFNLVIRKITNTKFQIAISAAVLIILILVWAELAVGIFGTPISGS